MTYFAQNLRKLRINAGVMQSELAEYLSISHQTISGYEMGKRECNFAVLIKISDYFGVTVDELLKAPID